MPSNRFAYLLFVLLVVAACGGDDPSNPDDDDDDDNTRPTASIMSPTDSASFQDDSPVLFQGNATDAEDGILTGDNLVWRSDVSGQIGTGQSFSTNSLIIGEHEIWLIATDEDGGRDTAKVTIVVEAAVDLNAPGILTMTIEPDSVDVTSDSAEVVVMLHVDDDMSGTSSVEVVLESASGAQLASTTVNAPTTGTRLNGTWHATLVIPEGAEAGDWTILGIALYDAAGNSDILDATELVEVGFESVVHVTNTN